MWVNQYIGQKWTQEQDCGYWFRKIQKEQFGRDVPVICNVPNEPAKFMRNAMKLMAAVKKENTWTETDNPIEGDAALLAMRTHIHHVGIVCFINGMLHIVHALENNGVVITDKLSLKQNLWRIDSYYTYGN